MERGALQSRRDGLATLRKLLGSKLLTHSSGYGDGVACKAGEWDEVSMLPRCGEKEGEERSARRAFLIASLCASSGSLSPSILRNEALDEASERSVSDSDAGGG